MKRKCVDGCKLILAIIVIAIVTGLFPANISKVLAADEEIDISDAEVTYEYTHQYTGTAIEPEVSVVLDGKDILPYCDIQYISNVNQGYGTIIIKGDGDYTGAIRRTFKIISSAAVASNEISSPVYNIQNDIQDSTWDTIYFGNYPQSEVTPEDDVYESLQNATGWDTKDDVTIDGVKYHRINQETADKPYIGDKLDTFYPWEYGTTYHYFRYEPILWRVLNVEGDCALLLSDEVLDTQSYCNGQYWTHTQYEISKLRSWLNGYESSENSDGIDFTSDNFIDRAFTDEQQNNIEPVEVIDALDLYDNIFLLSVDEMCNDAYGLNSSNGRMANNSAYAWAMGGWYTHGSNYWLRRRFSMTSIEAGGKDEVASMPVVYGNNIDYTSYSPADHLGIRPAMYINWKEADWIYGGACKSNLEKSPDYDLNPNVYLDSYEYTYTGSQITPGVTVNVKGVRLNKGTDYDVSYGDNVNAGTGTVTVTLKGDYAGTITKLFDIHGIDISTQDIELEYSSVAYDGTAKRPSISIEGLSEGVDYTVTYYNNTEIGTGCVIVSGKGRCSGAKELNFIIKHANLESTILTSSHDSKGRPHLEWEPVEDVDKYEVQRASSEDGEYETIYTDRYGVLCYYTDIAPEGGEVFYYRVKAIYTADDSCSSYSNVVAAGRVYNAPNVGGYNDPVTGKPYISTGFNQKNVEKVEIYRAESEAGTYTKIGSVEKSDCNKKEYEDGSVGYEVEYLDASAVAEKIYYYKAKLIHSIDHSLDSELSEEAFSITCKNVALSAVTGLKATNVSSSGKPKLTWTAVSGADKYEIYRATSKSGTYTKMTAVTKTSYTNTSAIAGKTYYYKVKAIDADHAANSAWSEVVSRTCDLARVTGLKATNVASSGKPKLSWKAVKSAGKYEIYRATKKSGTYKRVKATTKTSYTDSSALAEKTYYYKVKAIYSSKTAANSALTSCVSKACDLKRPVITVKRNSSGKPKATWSKISGADKYYVYRATSKNGTYKKIATTKKLYYTNTSVKKGKTYYYKVKAVSTSNSNANSALSLYKSCTAK